MTTTKITTFAALVLAAGLALTACSNTPEVEQTPQATTPVVEDTQAPVEDTQASVETPAAPVADEYSQVINGVLYQGTEKAPVRIGTDVPGQAPAVEAQLTRANSETLTQESNKYLVYVAPTDGGWYWKVFGMSRRGSFRELANSGLSRSALYPSRDAALAGPFMLDGRALDRAEYLLAVEAG